MSTFDQLPHEPNLETTKFTVEASEDELQDFIGLIRRSKLGPKTYENSASEEREGLNKYGVTFDWMAKAKERWESGFNWYENRGKTSAKSTDTKIDRRSIEQRVNKFPNFKTRVVDDDGSTFSVHFVGLFSRKKDAIPLVFIHGWPGRTILNFLFN
jgi:microsomal epoxide hydrolase